MINKAIREQIQDIIRFGERSQEYKSEETITVFDLLQIYNDRALNMFHFCAKKQNEADDDLKIIKRIDILPGQDIESSLIELRLKLDENKYCLIQMDRNHILKQSDYCMYSKIEQQILNKYYNLFKDIARYGIINNYNKLLRINTISNEFQIINQFDSFLVTMPSQLLESYGKHVILSYPYILEYFNNHNQLENDFTTFNISTNVMGVKKLLNSENEYNEEKINNTIRFLENLQVYESDIPEYLKPAVEKVKVLKK